MKAWEIVGYDYMADRYCAREECIMPPVYAQCEGWELVQYAEPMTVEDNLAEIAYAFGIDRFDERSYDSSEFPKVIFASIVEDDSDACAHCGAPLIED